MEKELGSIKITETDDGYRIDINGKDLKKIMPCCIPIVNCDCDDGSECCVKIVKGGKEKDCC